MGTAIKHIVSRPG